MARSRNEAWPEGTPVLAQSKDYNGFVEFIAAKSQAMARLPAEADDLGRFVVAQPLATVIRALDRTRPVIGQRCAVVGVLNVSEAGEGHKPGLR